MDLSRWLARGGAAALPGLLAVGLVVVAEAPRPARAQAAAGETETATIGELRRTIEELQRALAARDVVIADMLRRMGELERRLAVTAPPERAPAPPGAEPAPAPPAPPPPAPPSAAEAAPPAPPAPGRFEVEEEAVATALERALVQEGALLLPPGAAQVQPSFSFARQEADGPAFLVRDGQQVLAAGEVRGDGLTAGLTLRLGLPFDSQLSLGVPYRYQDVSTVTRTGPGEVDERSRDAAGFGDLSVGLSKGLLRERGWRPDLIAGVSWNADIGQSDGGVHLGSGFNEVTAGLTASKSQDPLVFVGSLSYGHAFEEDGVAPGDAVGLSLGVALAASPETSLRFFLDQSFVFEAEIDGEEVPGSDEVVSLFNIGASTILTPRVLLDVELGIGLTESAPDYTIGVALPIRFNLPFRF